jgi:hypothetical protein
MNEQEVRLQQLRNRREALVASGHDEEARDLDEAIAEAQGASLLGDGAPRP